MEEDEYVTPVTLEFPPEPAIELTEDDLIELLIEWYPVVGDC